MPCRQVAAAVVPIVCRRHGFAIVSPLTWEFSASPPPTPDRCPVHALV